MELSPGMELVWALAGRETVSARLPSVEPDHFFCGLLKFGDADDDTLRQVASSPDVAAALAAERDRLRRLLEERLPRTGGRAEVLRAVRKAAAHGDHQHAGGTLHRSDAARKLFERAARQGARQNGTLETSHLLQALLDTPTPAMARALGGAPAPAEGEPGQPRAATPLLDQHAVELAPPVVGDVLPETTFAQVRALAAALRAADPAPIVLVCELQVRVPAIVAAAARNAEPQMTIARVDLAGLRKAAGKQGQLADLAAGLLSEASQDEGRALFLDGLKLAGSVLPGVLAAMRAAALKQPALLALPASGFGALDVDDDDWQSAFRIIWLHALAADLPHQV